MTLSSIAVLCLSLLMAQMPSLSSTGSAPPTAPTLDKALDEPVPARAGSGGEKYVGVVPGPNGHNPLPRAKKTPPRLIWSGFQAGDKGSKVFFQTNQPVTFELGSPSAGDGKSMTVFLRNCRIHLRNNRRRLDTSYFATPVEGVTVVQRRKDVELRIALKEPASATPRSEPGPDGSQFVVLEFPPGKAKGEPGAPASVAAGGQPAESGTLAIGATAAKPGVGGAAKPDVGAAAAKPGVGAVAAKPGVAVPAAKPEERMPARRPNDASPLDDNEYQVPGAPAPAAPALPPPPANQAPAAPHKPAGFAR